MSNNEICTGECGICDGSCEPEFKNYDMQKKKIYIAGKVTGEEFTAVTMKFGAAQKKLEAEGYEVINPLEVVANAMSKDEQMLKVNWERAMKLCIAAMMQANEIFMLRDFQQSTGAQIEYKLAIDLNYKIRLQ